MTEETNINETSQTAAPAQPSFGAGLLSAVKKFNFKARTLKDADGKEIEKLPKQPSLEVTIPVPNADTVVSILSGPDEFTETGPDDSIITRPNLLKQMVLEAIHDIVFAQAKQQFDAAIESFGADKT
jgi:hypothetical protein